MTTTHMKHIEEEVAAAVQQKPHWSIRLYVTDDTRTGECYEARSLIPIPLSWWVRTCLRMAGFRVSPREPITTAPGRIHRIRGKGPNDK